MDFRAGNLVLVRPTIRPEESERENEDTTGRRSLPLRAITRMKRIPAVDSISNHFNTLEGISTKIN